MLKPHILFDHTKTSKKIKNFLDQKIKNISLGKCNLIIVVGGDGFMLSSLKKYNKYKKPFYGINAGSYGFLMIRRPPRSTRKESSAASVCIRDRYLVEGEDAGFDNIPRSIYWAIVTLTTVGYGDISPITNLGQSIAAIIMIMGYGLIAVPTGIVTSEITFATRVKRGQKCVVCNRDRIRRNAKFCSDCGSKLVKNN